MCAKTYDQYNIQRVKILCRNSNHNRSCMALFLPCLWRTQYIKNWNWCVLFYKIPPQAWKLWRHDFEITVDQKDPVIQHFGWILSFKTPDPLYWRRVAAMLIFPPKRAQKIKIGKLSLYLMTNHQKIVPWYVCHLDIGLLFDTVVYKIYILTQAQIF